MGWFSNLFKKKKETQPIAKVQSSTNFKGHRNPPPPPDEEIRVKREPVYHAIVRDFQGKFVKGNPYDLKRDPKTGRYMKKK